MRRVSFLLLLAACGAEEQGSVIRPSDWVRPLIGTGGQGYGVGSVPPGPSLPFGLAKPGPDTATNGGYPGFSHCAGYWSEDDQVRAFSQLHLEGTGIPDYGVLGLMPALDLAPGPLDPSAWSAKLVHALERAEAGYYKLDLVPSRIVVELTTTARTALYRLSYPAGGSADLVIDLDHGLGGTTDQAEIQLDAQAQEASGWLHHLGDLSDGPGYTVYFVLRFDRPFSARQQDQGRRSILSFGSEGGRVQLQLGLSFLDLASARANLEAEWKSFDFDRAREEARQAWDQALGVVEIEGGTDRQRAMFYSALYRSELMPTLFTEGGRYRGLDGEVHAAEGYTYYTDFSLWDTFRTEHPLLTLVAPARQRDFVRSLLAMTEDSGQIPKWPLATIETNTMIAYHGETVLVDSYLKGLGGFDGERAWSFIRRAALEVGAPGRQRDCMQSYSTLGYCAADQEGRSVSKTLENGFADFAAARLAEALGHAEDAALLSARSQAYAQLIHPETRFAQPRNADGSFVPGFREDFFDGAYTEGNARQWTPFVPHDVAGLARAVGGADALVSMLERIFEGAAAAEKTIFPDLWYWHGNEPDIHAAYMFAELGRPELTTRWVRWIMNARYDDTPGGLDGNDDGGTLSSWYVFSALGLFPKVAEARYVVGVPLFPAATLHLENGASVRILAPGLTETSEVRRVFWNGRALDGPFLSHAELIAGGELRFEVGP